jgi:hypothetical protein
MKLITASVIYTLVMFVIPEHAEALCVQPQEEGSWQSTDPQMQSLTQIQLGFVCQDQMLNGEPYPSWYVRLW